MALEGALNGTDVFILVLNRDTESWLPIGGQVSHSVTGNNAPIDITNKFSGKVRELMEGAGLKTVDVSAEFIFSSDLVFEYIKKAALNRSIEKFQIFKGSPLVFSQISMMVTSINETASDNAALTASISFISSEAMQLDINAEAFFTTPDGQFMVTPIGGDPENFYVREI